MTLSGLGHIAAQIISALKPPWRSTRPAWKRASIFSTDEDTLKGSFEFILDTIPVSHGMNFLPPMPEA